jgi:hypothetical protein
MNDQVRKEANGLQVNPSSRVVDALHDLQSALEAAIEKMRPKTFEVRAATFHGSVRLAGAEHTSCRQSKDPLRHSFTMIFDPAVQLLRVEDDTTHEVRRVPAANIKELEALEDAK